MNYKLLLGCLCVGTGLSVLYYRFTSGISSNFLDIVISVLTLVAGVYFISKGREEKKLMDKGN